MLTLLVIALIVSGCGSNGQPTAVTSLAGAGATFPYPLYSKVFDTYDAATGVRVNYNSIGSGGGIKALTDKTVDFGVPTHSSRTRKTCHGSACPAHPHMYRGRRPVVQPGRKPSPEA